MKSEAEIREAWQMWSNVATMRVPFLASKKVKTELEAVKKEAEWFAKGLEWVLEES